MKKTSSEYCCFIFSNIYQNDDKIGSGFPPTSGQIYPQLRALRILIGQIGTPHGVMSSNQRGIQGSWSTIYQKPRLEPTIVKAFDKIPHIFRKIKGDSDTQKAPWLLHCYSVSSNDLKVS